MMNGIPVHRFAIAPHDPECYQTAVQTLLQDPAARPAAEELLRHSVNSARLLEALRQRRADFDAVITGPYGIGLTHAVARTFPAQTLMLPCFHDEPLARLPIWPETYGEVGGLLYHTPEEQEFAQTRLGVNHPRAVCCGTALNTTVLGNPERGRRHVRTERPYVVYCGRYSREKELPTLLEQARCYYARHPERFTFVFFGAGGVSIPAEPWARDLGFVDEGAKRDVLAGAAALLLPSRRESLSLAALEAWGQAVPVIAERRCAVLAGHLQRGGGGRLVEGPDEWSSALDDLWTEPDVWRERGRQGQAYVRDRYGSRAAFAETLTAALRQLREPLAECMRRRGRARAADFSRATWRERFGTLVEQVLDAPPRPVDERLTIVPRSAARTATAGVDSLMVPVRITNTGTLPLLTEGPARVLLQAVARTTGPAPRGRPTPLPGLLMPGQSSAVALPVPVPATLGEYPVTFETRDDIEVAAEPFTLVVNAAELPGTAGCCAPMLDLVRASLAEAEALQGLPADYADVSEGWLASWKRWLKRKLLGNFKRAYVDVLSRQQSAFNQHALTALRELAESCATLDSAARASHDLGAVLPKLLDQLAQSEARCRELEARLHCLERSGVAEARD